MHLDLHDMNSILDQQGSEERRLELASHLVDCPQCGRRFKALHALHRSHRQARPKPRFVFLAAAAAILVAVTGFFMARPTMSAAPQLTSIVQVSRPQIQTQELNLLGEVQRVNVKHALPQWGKTENMMDLVRKTRRSG